MFMLCIIRCTLQYISIIEYTGCHSHNIFTYAPAADQESALRFTFFFAWQDIPGPAQKTGFTAIQ